MAEASMDELFAPHNRANSPPRFPATFALSENATLVRAEWALLLPPYPVSGWGAADIAKSSSEIYREKSLSLPTPLRPCVRVSF